MATADELAVRQRLKDDFGHYAARVLRIKDKAGALRPLVLNRAQAHVHERLEAQRARTGRVRALILKARQQGFSTYIAGRFYWRATHRRGASVYILTHEQAATDNLFAMVERYHEHCHPLVKPKTGKANAREMSFPLLDGGYSVGTAGVKAAGRSRTVQLFHGSEVAFWPNAREHFGGIVQAVPDTAETEIILESTANGVGGEFYERWQRAEVGDSDYEAIFVPWFWSEEYRLAAGPEFTASADELTLAERFGLDAGQLAWRRRKIADLGEALFKQEYPATAAEAFQITGHDSFIPGEIVLAARKADREARGPLIMGVDPARFGDDGFAIAWRRGRKVLKVETRHRLDVVAGANWVREAIDADRPDRVFVDVGGVGAGVVDILRAWGSPYDKLVRPINFGGEPQQAAGRNAGAATRPGPRNRRAEMWARSRDWLADPGGADVPDEDGLQRDACGPSYSYDMGQRLVLESKDRMRARGARSPDGWDAVALTFAEPVRSPPTRSREDDGCGAHRETGWMGM